MVQVYELDYVERAAHDGYDLQGETFPHRAPDKVKAGYLSSEDLAELARRGFADVTERDDACPNYLSERERLWLFVRHPAPYLRESPADADLPRFALCHAWLTPDGWQVDDFALGEGDRLADVFPYDHAEETT